MQLHPGMMPGQPDPTQPPSTTTNDHRRFAPFVVLLLIFGLLTARWIWIAGITDYAWTYELGMRVWQGQVPYRDFICTLPQLTSYTMVPFLALFKGNLWGFAVDLYLWWLASLWVGLLVVRKLGLSTPLQSASIFLAGCVSFPPMGLGHPYSYAGTFFFAVVLLCLLQHRAAPKTSHLLLGGAGAGLALLAKQNIGLAALGLGFLALAQVATDRANHRSLLGDAFGSAAGATAARLAYVLGAMFVCTHAAFPHPTYRLGTFEALPRFPDDSRFANLWAAPSYAGGVEELLANVGPRIQGRRTLWISIGGPHLAFGGAPVRSVATLHFDTYHARSEAGLMEEWNRHPPEFVFLGYYVPCVGSRFLTREALDQWLPQRYQRVWQSPERDSSLWELKSKSETAAN